MNSNRNFQSRDWITIFLFYFILILSTLWNQLQNEGTKLDIELDGKNMLFGRTLLYRIEYRYLTIINNTPVSFFWFLELEDQVNPQISFIPYEGMIDAHSRQEVEFQYNANMVTRLLFQLCFNSFARPSNSNSFRLENAVIIMLLLGENNSYVYSDVFIYFSMNVYLIELDEFFTISRQYY